MAQILDIADEDFKMVTINIIKEIKENWGLP